MGEPKSTRFVMIIFSHLWPVIRAFTLGFGHHSQGVCTLNMQFYLCKNTHPTLSCCKSLETLLYPSSDLILEAIRWHFSPHPQLWVVWYIFTLHVDNWSKLTESLFPSFVVVPLMSLQFCSAFLEDHPAQAYSSIGCTVRVPHLHLEPSQALIELWRGLWVGHPKRTWLEHIRKAYSNLCSPNAGYSL